MDLGLKDKVAIVTGSSRGIGRSIALGLADEGCNLVLCARGEDALLETAQVVQKKGVEVVAVTTDVTSKDGVSQVVDQAMSSFKRIDVLVNNAGGLLERKAIMEVDETLWDECFDLNMKSVFLCCQAVVPLMKKQGFGKIVNVSSIAARNGGGPGAVHYSTSKSAVLTFTKGLAKELAQTGITVNNVSPGIITTPFHDKFTSKETRDNFKKAIPMGREGTPQETAWSILFLASGFADYIVGETLEINGGMLMD